MAFRLDDLIVSEKNIFLVADGKHYVADIEKEAEFTNTFNKSRDRNPWNLRTSDGQLINNIFDISSFSVRTQVLTGLNGVSRNYRQSHEEIFMPNCETCLGGCQFYDNAYFISDFTNDKFTASYNTTSGIKSGKYEADNSFVKYEHLQYYDNMIDYYINPTVAYTIDKGSQYITEFPINKFYSDFGDNENTEDPTVYGDSFQLKGYLDDKYSVDASDVNNTQTEFSKFRQYFDIGNSGNSIYLVYRNNLMGSAHVCSNDGHYCSTGYTDNDIYVVTTALSSVAYMSNITTMCDKQSSNNKIVYGADPYSDFFDFDSISSMNGFDFIKQPKDKSFILYFKKSSSETKVLYISRAGLEKSCFEYGIDETTIEQNDILELQGTVIIPTHSHGLIVVENSVCSYENGNIKVDYTPFKFAKVGNPLKEEELLTLSGGVDNLSNFKLYYNDKDILGLVADNKSNKVALLSTSLTSENGMFYDAGYFFMKTGKPHYEAAIETTEYYSPWTTVVSSCPSSYTLDGKQLVTYYLSSVQTRELTASEEHLTYDYASNKIEESTNILFDYCPVTISGEVSSGSYAFIQFDDYGLSKCHVDDIFKDDMFVRTSTAGVINTKQNIRSSSKCIDVKFELMSYGENEKDNLSKTYSFVGINSNTNRIYGKSALYTTYRYTTHDAATSQDIYNHYNTFAALPFNDGRDILTQPVFSTASTSGKVIEYSRPASGVSTKDTKFILDIPIEKSKAVSVKTYKSSNVNHDAAISLVKWNNTNDVASTTVADFTSLTSTAGDCHLQYNGICTEIYITGKNITTESNLKNDYNSTIYEYPHHCFGDLKTAGTGLPIFEGRLANSMTVGDIFMLNDYLIVKNYAVKTETVNTTSTSITDTIRESGKYYSYDTGSYLSGGYVVTNFFRAENNSIDSLYDSELKYSSKEHSKTSPTSETIYDYSYLWHIKPTKAIEFYPASEPNKKWSPFYVGKYVDFIKYHNGYYYIALSNSKDKTANTTGCELIETDDLFKEKKVSYFPKGKYVSDINFFDNNVAVEYTTIQGTNSSTDVYWFKSGKAASKVHSMKYHPLNASASMNASSVNRSNLVLSRNSATEAQINYDNVEVIHSLNRFNSVVNHKSNMFSIKVSDLGLDESPYLTETQKKNLKTWFKNRITSIVDSVKPANTQLFDVYID